MCRSTTYIHEWQHSVSTVIITAKYIIYSPPLLVTVRLQYDIWQHTGLKICYLYSLITIRSAFTMYIQLPNVIHHVFLTLGLADTTVWCGIRKDTPYLMIVIAILKYQLSCSQTLLVISELNILKYQVSCSQTLLSVHGLIWAQP